MAEEIWTRAGWTTALIGLVVAVVGLMLLLVPTQVYVDLPAADPNDGVIEDAFFACGTALFPGVDPAGEGALPERACAEVNEDWRTASAVTTGFGIALLAGGALTLTWRRRAGESSVTRLGEDAGRQSRTLLGLPFSRGRGQASE